MESEALYAKAAGGLVARSWASKILFMDSSSLDPPIVSVLGSNVPSPPMFFFFFNYQKKNKEKKKNPYIGICRRAQLIEKRFRDYF